MQDRRSAAETPETDAHLTAILSRFLGSNRAVAASVNSTYYKLICLTCLVRNQFEPAEQYLVGLFTFIGHGLRIYVENH